MGDQAIFYFSFSFFVCFSLIILLDRKVTLQELSCGTKLLTMKSFQTLQTNNNLKEKHRKPRVCGGGGGAERKIYRYG